MSTLSVRLRAGDLVEVKTPEEILQTLDGDGTLDRLPFMPEMVAFCGRRFRVSGRVHQTCSTGPPNPYAEMRVFREDDVVLLDGLRCSGAAHDGCQKDCAIFWREAWLRKVEPGAEPVADAGAGDRLRSRLKTMAGPTTYFCQSSELIKATESLSRREQFKKCARDVRAGDCGALRMAARLALWVFWKIRRRLVGEYSRGRAASATPAETLNLQPGDWVEVKPLESIRDTLNASGYNRGLYFTPGMGRACGRKYQVGGRIDRIIVDGSGEMRRMRNTVRLEHSECRCAILNVGGCSRREVNYWREIWLRRIPTT